MRGLNRVISSPFLRRRALSRGGPFRSIYTNPYYDSERGKWRELPYSIEGSRVLVYMDPQCPLAYKVSAFLDFFKIPTMFMFVNPITKEQIKWSHRKSLPIFVVDNDYDQPFLDSSDFINRLVKGMVPNYDPNADEEEKKWLEWVDNCLLHVVSANMYGTFSQALKSFDYMEVDHSLSERLVSIAKMYAYAAAMHIVGKKLKKKHNITDQRAVLRGAVGQWFSALRGRKFLGGNNPNLADIAVFGTLTTVRLSNLDRHFLHGWDGEKARHVWFTDMDRAMESGYWILPAYEQSN